MTSRQRILELLAWCLPALLVGFALRAMMATAMPFAYVQHDSIRLLVSGEEWLAGDYDLMSNNVPFLVPAFCRLAQAGPIPGLITIQLVQHALGLLQIVLAGALTRLWFTRWEVWIIPVTLVFAIHPSFLWFEHTVMLETFYVFAVVLIAWAGTWLARERTLPWAAVFCATIVGVAVTRPEGKLFLPFAALLLAMVFWRRWKEFAAAAALWVATAGVVSLATVSGESGFLLYSSVIHLSPAKSKYYPAAAPYVAAFRQEALDLASRDPAFVSRPQRVALGAALAKFVAEHPTAGGGGTIPKRMNRVGLTLAYEACLAKPWALPPLAVQKFRATAADLAHGKFTESWMHERQMDRVRGAWRFLQPISKRIWGREFTTAEQAAAFVKESFPPGMPFFMWLHEEWGDLYSRRLPATHYATVKLPGLPLLYFLPIAGMVAAAAASSRIRPFHICWVVMLAGLWLIIMISANERSRFRMAFEPFIFLYAFVALAFAAEGMVELWRRFRRRAPAASPNEGAAPDQRA